MVEFVGQRLSENIFDSLICSFGLIGWVLGFFQEDFTIVFQSWLVGVVLSIIVSEIRLHLLRLLQIWICNCALSLSFGSNDNHLFQLNDAPINLRNNSAETNSILPWPLTTSLLPALYLPLSTLGLRSWLAFLQQAPSEVARFCSRTTTATAAVRSQGQIWVEFGRRVWVESAGSSLSNRDESRKGNARKAVCLSLGIGTVTLCCFSYRQYGQEGRYWLLSSCTFDRISELLVVAAGNTLHPVSSLFVTDHFKATS